MSEPHITEVKKKEVEDIKNLVKKHKVIGIVDMCNLPALQLQRIKKNLKDLNLKFTKKRLIKIAFDQLKDEKKNIVELKEKLIGMPALIFTDGDPFDLAKLIKNNQSNAPAKAGQTAPIDLIVPAGPTNFAAGPMIGELGALGIKTKVEGGKISVINDKVLVKEGDVINAKQADLLAKLGVEPMKIGLNLLFTYENGEILSKDVLFVDEELYINNLKKASSEAVTLALEIGYVVKDTAELLLAKAYREAKKLEETAKIKEVKVEEKKEEIKIEEKKVEKVEEKKPEPAKEESVEKKEEPKIEEKKEEVKEEPVKEEPKVEEKPKEEPKPEIKEEPEPVVEEKEVPKPEPEPVKEESKIEEPVIEKEPSLEKNVHEEKEIKETPLEKEIKQQEEIVEEQAPKDKEDKVVIDTKKDGFEEMAEKAKEILYNVVTEKLKKEGSPIHIKSSKMREKIQVDDVNKFINELKDKKAMEEK